MQLVLELVEGDYRAVLAHDVTQGFDLCYSNNVIEHVEDPDDFMQVSLLVAPMALHVLPLERHGWCDDHRHAWTIDRFIWLCRRHGRPIEWGVMDDPPPFPCDERDCRHQLQFALIARR